jgi:hypothetical protein
MKLAIFGSRTLNDERVIDAIIQAVDRHKPAVIVTAGEPEGVCSVARDYARIAPLPLMLFFVDERRNAGKYHWRSVAVYQNCDHCLLIHDGTSHGTRNEIELAVKMNIPHAVITMEQINA